MASDDVRGSVPLKLEQQSTAGETDGNQHPEDGGCTEDLRSHGKDLLFRGYLNPFPAKGVAGL